MSPIGLFTYYRTYSRFFPEKSRRETWKETVARTVQYNVGLDYIHRNKIGIPVPTDWLKQEAEELFDGIWNLRQFPSGRSLWIGGTSVAEDYPMANFNCSFTNIEKWEDLAELFYLLMLGSGVGFKCTKKMAAGLPPIRINTNMILSPYEPLPEDHRLQDTDTRFLANGFAKIYVGDSKEGWRDALSHYFQLLTKPEHENIHTIKISFNSVRPRGERLKTFGGTASGPTPLMEMFHGFDNVLKNKIDESLAPIVPDERGYGRVRPIHILDMGNLIGNNVVSGGVRRTAELFLFDDDDLEVLFAKYGINGFWTVEHFAQHEKVLAQLYKMGIEPPPWFDEFSKGKNKVRQGIEHRRLSNNSIGFLEKPSDDFMDLVFLMLQLDGEPGFINLKAAGERRFNAEGVNPCAEILLDNKQQCNLTTINLTAFSEDGVIKDYDGLMKAQALSARAGLRMTLIDLELPEWDFKHKRDRLTGCSMTGYEDATSRMELIDKELFLEDLESEANYVADEYAKELRIQTPLLVTTVKPEGSLSVIAGGVSPGLHDAHAPYYIRRVRISADDALAKAMIDVGWKYDEENKGRTLVFSFPIQSGAIKTKNDVSALDQLDRYLMFQQSYTNHNSSNTITVRPEEWGSVKEYIKRVWDRYVGVSFLALDGGTYHLAPLEEITREEFDKMSSEFIPFDPSILQKYETVGVSELDSDDPDCSTGACPIR
jgi:ribonucleoside-diphosphate reductase alpha chain/ribonucleoside-triphosphate reductase